MKFLKKQKIYNVFYISLIWQTIIINEQINTITFQSKFDKNKVSGKNYKDKKFKIIKFMPKHQKIATYQAFTIGFYEKITQKTPELLFYYCRILKYFVVFSITTSL